MILQLMFVLAASSLALPSEDNCPDDEACLYHYHCSKVSPTGDEIVLATTDPGKYAEWIISKCSHGDKRTKLSVRPLSNHMWNITFHSPYPNLGISFGDSLLILTNQTRTTIKGDSEGGGYRFCSTCIFKERRGVERGIFAYWAGVQWSNTCPVIESPLFTVFNIEQEEQNRYLITVVSDKKLLDIFASQNISYFEKDMKNGATSSAQPLFWERISAITPCDASIIIDDCTNTAVNCTKLDQDKDSAKCLNNDTLWMKAEKSTWQEILSISCDADKEWILTNENGTEILRKERMSIRCAAEQPEPWTNHGNTILHSFILPFILCYILQ